MKILLTNAHGSYDDVTSIALVLTPEVLDLIRSVRSRIRSSTVLPAWRNVGTELVVPEVFAHPLGVADAYYLPGSIEIESSDGNAVLIEEEFLPENGDENGEKTDAHDWNRHRTTSERLMINRDSLQLIIFQKYSEDRYASCEIDLDELLQKSGSPEPSGQSADTHLAEHTPAGKKHIMNSKKAVRAETEHTVARYVCDKMAGFEGHEGEALTGAQKILTLVIKGLSTEQFASLKGRVPTREKSSE